MHPIGVHIGFVDHDQARVVIGVGLGGEQAARELRGELVQAVDHRVRQRRLAELQLGDVSFARAGQLTQLALRPLQRCSPGAQLFGGGAALQDGGVGGGVDALPERAVVVGDVHPTQSTRNYTGGQAQ